MERWQIIIRIGIGIGIAIAALGGLPAFVGCSTRLWSSAPEYLVAARWTNRDSTFLTRDSVADLLSCNQTYGVIGAGVEGRQCLQ